MQYSIELHKTPSSTRLNYTNLHRLVKVNFLIIVFTIKDDSNEVYIFKSFDN